MDLILFHTVAIVQCISLKDMGKELQCNNPASPDQSGDIKDMSLIEGGISRCRL